MPSHFTVIYDACIFYPQFLRDVCVQLATTGLFRARWTDRIHEEWMGNLSERIPRDKLLLVRELIDRSNPDCLVTGYEPLEAALLLPDPNDVHVLAAAIKAGAEVIVSLNCKDFPASALKPYDIECQHPDVFIHNTINLNIPVACAALKQVRMRMKNPPRTPAEFLQLMEQRNLFLSEAALRPYAAML